MGHLIAIEGLDGSGKGTQTQILYESLAGAGLPAKTVSFPDYESQSSALVKMYLNGDFGTHPQDVNGYAASAFFAVDRYASYKTGWKDAYEAGEWILCNRYTTSNLFHQMVKVEKNEWDAFIHWLSDFEYQKLGLPEPNIVLYFDMDPAVSQKLLSGRYQGNEQKKDIHERDKQYLLDCRETALYAAEKLGWTVIRCYENGEPLPIDTIAQTVKSIVKEKLGLTL